MTGVERTARDLIHELRILGEWEWRSWWTGRAQRAMLAAADALEAAENRKGES